MGRKRTSVLTLVVMEDASRPVRTFRFPKSLLLWIPFSCAAVLAWLLVWLLQEQHAYEATIRSLTQTIGENAGEYARQIGERDAAIRMLQEDLWELSEQAAAFQHKLDDIRELELTLRELTGISEERHASEDADVSAVTQSANIGGEFRTGSPAQLQRFADGIKASIDRADAGLKFLIPRLEAAEAALREEIDRRNHTPSRWPVVSREISSSFGFRRDPFTGRSAHHNGIDIAADTGAKVYAAAEGTVEEEGWDPQKGNYIVLSHGYGLRTAYLHLSSIKVTKGQHVEKGGVIGSVGSTGRSTGPHLHFEVLRWGEPVDPVNYLTAANEPEDS
jgi:murein DD-endopeptidase MepM/ murein hydrolase activator NlpD